MNLKAGDRIGDYEILGVLGAGGMGSVYKIRNVISDRVEALKLLLPNLAEHQDLKDRFLREIKTSASLEHPSIASLRTAFQSGDMLLMVMEFVEGKTLDELLKAGPLPIDDAVRYTAQVLDALEYAHSRGVVHRDIKPANVMITPARKAKLLDFGIAKASSDKQLTMTGTTLGSLYYMSPEQIRGEHVDARADLYSLGITLYELTTGKRPFGGDSGYAIMAEHLQKQPVPPVELDARVPPSLNAVILRALAKNPADRYQDAAGFQNALKAAPTSAAVGVSNDQTAPRAAAPAPPAVPHPSAAPNPPTAPMPSGGQPLSSADAQPTLAHPQGARSLSSQPFAADPMPHTPQKKPKNTLALALVAVAAILIVAAVGLVIGASYFFGSSGNTVAAKESPGIFERIAGMFSSETTAESTEKPGEATSGETGEESSAASEPDPASFSAATNPISVDDITSESGGSVSAGTTAGGPASGSASTASVAASTSAGNAGKAISSAAAKLATQTPASGPAQSQQSSGSGYERPATSSYGGDGGYGSAQSPQATTPTPAAPKVDPRVLEERQDFFAKLGIRAGTVQESARKLAQEQSAMGVSLRADIRASIKRMEYLMDQAEASLNASDLEKAKSQMAGAEREIEKLEKFFGI